MNYKTSVSMLWIGVLLLPALGGPISAADLVLLEAEAFNDRGGWVIDQQSMDQMGSPYLMAHGLGVPVEDAITVKRFPKLGVYRLWVRTRDWVGPWKGPETTRTAMRAEGCPGRFQIVIDGRPLPTIFGTEKAEWHWQDGGTVQIRQTDVKIAIRDLTGFNGRCDAIVFTTDTDLVPPNDLKRMRSFRRELLGHVAPIEGGQYDLVVVGGGIAGICSAISAARADCHVALIQNRPVLGGNNSSEVRVGLSGLIRQQPYPNLGNLVDEISPVGHWTIWDARRHPDWPRSNEVLETVKKYPAKAEHNAGPASNYEDKKKLRAVLAEENIALFLYTHVNEAEMDGNRIVAVIGQDIRTGRRTRFKGSLFADCTGDGNLGYLTKADYRQGRESKKETEEGLAPAETDELVMGTSVQWKSTREQTPSSFPKCPWAAQFDETTCIKTAKGDWNWETGADRDQVQEIERIRDYALRIVFGNWAVLKNHPKYRDEFAKRRLNWIAYIGGKRESRRLLGDVILRQQDITQQKPFVDASVTTTWTIDLHYPKQPACACDAFQSVAKHMRITPYPIPYRCLYSRNIDNLMMAGRNISVTHVALGTVRVQRTTGMMGEVLGMAASLCERHDCTPRDVYRQHLDDLKAIMTEGVPPRKATDLGPTVGASMRAQ